jgi:hypothetical protein
MLRTIAEVAELIRAGRKLLLAGDEKVLAALPSGEWIGGTIPYFMTEEGGRTDTERIFTTELPPEVVSTRIVSHRSDTLPRIAEEAAEHDFTFLILPFGSKVHVDYARAAPEYPQMFLRPIVGWVSGVGLAEQGKVLPKVVDGRCAEILQDGAVAMHCSLAPGWSAHLGIVNLFRQGGGDAITFPDDGFQVTDCWINGEKRQFAEYLRERHIDPKLPLVADYSGIMINVCFQVADRSSSRVSFYAPVFKNVTYKVAAPVGNYVEEFRKALPSGVTPLFTCNCILNYLYSELEGKKTEGMYGPVTFGEIAYQLLNQTLVYLTIGNE